MITVLGASGFIGSNLVEYLKNKQEDVYAPLRDEDLSSKKLGHVVYCIGLTADFRKKPFETIEAHVCKLKHVLEYCHFESFTYLSSTRVYIKSNSTNDKLNENDNIVLNPNDALDIFASSKLTAELLLLNSGKPNIKIVRVSNVFGNDFNSENFITSIVKDVLEKGSVELQTTMSSSKDYISINDVCSALGSLSKLEVSGLYNLAFSKNTTNLDITNEIARITGGKVIYNENAKEIIFQEIDNTKLNETINFKPSITVIQSLPDIISSFQEKI